MKSTELIARQQLADLYAVLAHFKWDDLIYTHASVRIPESDSFLINQFGLMFDEVTPSNLVRQKINADADIDINPAGYNVHNAIYKNRQDVECIIHLHTVEGVAVSVSRQGLLPLNHQSTAVLRSLAYHEYHGIIVDSDEEQLLQQSLGGCNHMILRNHGLLTVGDTVVNAFSNMYNLQRSCEIQALTRLEDCMLVPIEVSDQLPDQIKRFNQKQSCRQLAWDALLRKVKSKNV